MAPVRPEIIAMQTETIKNLDPYESSYQSLREELAAVGPSWFQPLRERGIERFRKAGFPSPTDEAWRFTDLRPLKKVDFDPRIEVAARLAGDAVRQLSLAGEQSHRLVFVNGRFVAEASSRDGSGQGPLLENLSRAGEDGEGAIREHLGSLVDLGRHRFSALNTAFLGDGAVVRIPAGPTKHAPVHLLFVSTRTEDPRVSFPRVMILVEDGAEATILEEYVGPDDGVYFTNSVTEIVLGRNASADHARVQREGTSAFHVGSVTAHLDRDSRFTSHAVSLGGRLSRVDLDVVLDGEGAECDLNGLYMLGGRQHMDHHTRVDHAKSHTASRQLYEGVLDGKATAVFNGRMVIRPDSQKVDVSQTNNNLLLSRDALVNTNPELQIFADDIKAQHGATIGQIEEEHLFYLRSRGIDEKTARYILIFGFAGKMIERLPMEAVREALVATLEARF
jgi:Fe-S cluster assembly protein SufD